MGGKVVKNYCEKFLDLLIYDEFLKFDRDIEGEGFVIFFGDKCLEGLVFGKLICGFMFMIKGEC